MKFRFEECIERGKIVKIPIDPALVKKEVQEAVADLAAAEHSLIENQMKWAIIQGYGGHPRAGAGAGQPDVSCLIAAARSNSVSRYHSGVTNFYLSSLPRGHLFQHV